MEETIKLKLLREELEKINNSKISLLELMIYDEIDCQVENDISDKDFWKIFCKVYSAYLKDDRSNLWGITKYCVENFDNLDNLDNWTIVANSYDE